MKVAVGTTNKAKLEAIRSVFLDGVEIIPCKVPSNVREQPFSDEETIQGAMNRAKNALVEVNADLGIGLEGGVTETKIGLMLCNWGALVLREKINEPYVAGGARIVLPEYISNRLRNGEELGIVMDDFCQQKNIRFHEGAVGIFTNGQVNRVEMFTHVVKLLKGQYEYEQKVIAD